MDNEAQTQTATVNLTVKVEFSDTEAVKKAAVARLESQTIEPEEEKRKEIAAATKDLKTALSVLLDPGDLSHDLDLVEIAEASTEIIMEGE